MQRQWREIGETEWEDCSEDWFDYCNKSELHDTRSVNKLLNTKNTRRTQMKEEQKEEFIEITCRVIDFLKKYGHPHMTVIIDQTHAELLEGVVSNDRSQKNKDRR